MKLKIAILDEAGDTSGADVTVEENLLAEHEEMQGFNDAASNVAEVSGIQDTLIAMQACPEKAAEIAIEHFMNVLGLDKNIAMESIGNETSTFNTRITNVLVVAQEGVLDRFVSTIDKALTSEAALLGRTTSAAKNIEVKGAKEGVIKNPGWGRIFTVPGKNSLSASNVQSTVAEYQRALNSSSLVKLVDQTIKIIKDVVYETNKSVFIADDDATARIEELTSEGEALIKSFDKIANLSNSKKNDNSYEPISADDAQKLMASVKALLLDKVAEGKFKELRKAIMALSMGTYVTSQSRVAGILAADIRKANVFISKINPTMQALADILSAKNKVCYSAIKYVEASTM